jgi:hypothetical protein
MVSPYTGIANWRYVVIDKIRTVDQKGKTGTTAARLRLSVQLIII